MRTALVCTERGAAATAAPAAYDDPPSASPLRADTVPPGVLRGTRWAMKHARFSAAASAVALVPAVGVMLGPLVTPGRGGALPGWSVADVAVICCALLLVLAAVLENRRRREDARAATEMERRRFARELHDGVLQELTLIRLEASLLPPSDGVRDRLLRACERAAVEAWSALHAAQPDGGRRLAPVLHGTISELAGRYGVELRIRLDESVEVDAAQQHELLRIAREAVANAARHSGATRIEVLLSTDGATRRLQIHDDGGGFDPMSARPGGYGLTSMRERAESLPGTFALETRPAAGTRVTVAW